MASLYSRLHSIFTAPGATATATAAAATKSTVTTVGCQNLQKLVDDFKRKSSRSPTFRTQKHRDYFSIVRRLTSANQLSMVEDIIEHQKTFSDITNEQFTTRLILLYGRAGMFDHARNLFDEMLDLKCERTVRSFNALLSACVDSGKYEKLEEIITDLPPKLGISPNVVSFNTLIKGYIEMGRLDSAISVLDEMKEMGIEPDVITFNTLLNGYYSSGDFAQGEKIWALMESSNVVPNTRSYNSRLRGLVSENRMEEAVELFDKMEEKGVEPDVISFNAVIKGLCNEGEVEKVKDWVKKLRESGCKPDRVSYVMLVPFFCQNDKIDSAHELCIEILDRGVPVIRTTLFKPVIEGLTKQSRGEEANRLLEMVNSNEEKVSA